MRSAISDPPHTNPPTSARRTLTDGLTRLLLTPHPVRTYTRALGLADNPGPDAAVVAAVDRPGDGWTVLTLRTHRDFRRPAPGSAVTLGVVIDGVVHRRQYSPVDPASRRDGLVTLAVRRHRGGLVSEHLWHHARPGDHVLVEALPGRLALGTPRPADVLLVSGGSGLTPMLAIAATLAGEHHAGRVAWLHYTPDAADLPQPGRLEALGRRPRIDIQVVPTRRAPAPTAAGPAAPTGHLTAEHLRAAAPWVAEADVYCCGPSGLHEALAGVLGPVAAARVHRETFVAERVEVPETDGGTVTHARSDVRADNPGVSLLEGAEAAGLRPTSGCRMGICHTCTAVRRRGATRDLRDGTVDDRPDVPVQICVSAPVGDVTIDL